MPGDGLVHVQTIRETPAETRAIPDRYSAWFVEQHPDQAMPAVHYELDIHELVSGLLRKGAGEPPNLFSYFQFCSGPGQKTEWSYNPTPRARNVP